MLKHTLRAPSLYSDSSWQGGDALLLACGVGSTGGDALSPGGDALSLGGDGFSTGGGGPSPGGDALSPGSDVLSPVVVNDGVCIFIAAGDYFPGRWGVGDQAAHF